jgi:hypothetical protein
VRDADEEHTGVLTFGGLTVNCIPGFPRGLHLEARGYWENADLVPFNVTLIGTHGASGSIRSVRGEISSQSRRRSLEIFSFSGRFAGTGSSTGLSAPVGGTAASLTLPRLPEAEMILPAMPRAESGLAGARFALKASAQLRLGRGSLDLDLAGVTSSGQVGCASGQATGGTIELRDADSRVRGVIEGGFASTCGERPADDPKARTLTVSVGGVLRDAAATAFSIQGSGQVRRGRVTALVLKVTIQGTGGAADAPVDDVRRLRSTSALYEGLLDGQGRLQGLRPPGRFDDPNQLANFEVVLSGHDGEHIALEFEGTYFPFFTRDGAVLLAPRSSSIAVGDDEYSTAIQFLLFHRNPSGTGRIVIAGAVIEKPPVEPPPPGSQDPARSVGFIIAEIDSGRVPFGLFSDGGSVRLEGRIASLRIDRKTYRPEVSGTLKVGLSPSE